MNNNISNYIDDGIGTDPTIVPIIESLDDKPKSEEKSTEVKEKETKSAKTNESIKNIIFVIITIILVGGVGYGIYYYLSLATSNKETFILNDLTIDINTELSQNIGDYGSFSSSIISKCSLNTSHVDITKAGTYTYSVTCDKDTKSASIIVLENNNLNIKSNVTYKTVGSSINPSDFTNDSNATFKNEDTVSSYLKSSGGPYYIELLSNNNSFYGILYVINENVNTTLVCTKDDNTDYFMFDSNGNNLISYRLTNYSYNENEYKNKLQSITNGTLNFNGIDAYVLRDDTGYLLNKFTNLDESILTTEFNTTITMRQSFLKDLYQNRDYLCN